MRHETEGLAAALLLAVAAAPPDRLPAAEPRPQEAVAPADRRPDLAPTSQKPTAIALTAEEEARARSLEGELRCPVCRSQSIRQSRSFMAEDMKRRIRELVRAGLSDAEVRGYFVARYGEWILLTPPKRGFNLAAYLLPILAVAAGAVGLVLAARRWSRSGNRVAATGPPPASPYLARLEKEIEETE